MNNTSTPWKWIPTLYFAEGLPYVAVMTIAVIMYNRMGLSNIEIALYTSWLYLPWVIKPVWSPLVDLIHTKRWWIVMMQLLIGVGFAGIAFSLDTDLWLQGSLAFFWLLAFSSATNDIASDGFYMIGLSPKNQAWYIGVRNTFYRIAMITGQGGFIILAGYLEKHYMVAKAWSLTFWALAICYLSLTIYHKFMLPKAEAPIKHGQSLWDEFEYTFISFFKKKEILRTMAFLLTFRFAEAQLVKIASPFLLDSADKGGLGLSTSQVGFAYGTVGVAALIGGGILGGIAIARKGLKYWLWPMALAITLPNLSYLMLALLGSSNLWLINCAVAVEQFGYGFGFTAYTLYIIYAVKGVHKTSHYAIATGFMALGMMLPGMVSGTIQNWLGYQGFFIWIMACSILVYWGVYLINPFQEEASEEMQPVTINRSEGQQSKDI